jgi:hypothetical protein
VAYVTICTIESSVFDDLGAQLVKNIAHPVRAFRLRIGETQAPDIPAPDATTRVAEDSSGVPTIR